MKMHQITAAVALIGIGIGVSGCDISNSVAATNAADAAPAAVVHDGKLVTLPATSPLRHSVRSEVAASMALEHPFGAPGTIEAAPEKLVKVTSPLTGRLIKIHHTLGDRVNAGDPLFTLDSSDLSTAFGDASKAQAALLSAQQNLERQKPCMKPRSFPKGLRSGTNGLRPIGQRCPLQPVTLAATGRRCVAGRTSQLRPAFADRRQCH